MDDLADFGDFYRKYRTGNNDQGLPVLARDRPAEYLACQVASTLDKPREQSPERCALVAPTIDGERWAQDHEILRVLMGLPSLRTVDPRQGALRLLVP